MLIKGSCHCKKVRFEVESGTPYPYRRCYCDRCRKTQGGGGYAANLLADAASFRLEGEAHLTKYVPAGGTLESHFCSHCGSHLYIFLPEWPQWIYPFASAVDTPLPDPPEYFHVGVDQAPGWAHIPEGDNHKHFGYNTSESMDEWHRRWKLSEGAENSET